MLSITIVLVQVSLKKKKIASVHQTTRNLKIVILSTTRTFYVLSANYTHTQQFFTLYALLFTL